MPTKHSTSKSARGSATQVVVELSVDPAAARAPQPPPADVAGASSAPASLSRVRFATLGPDRTPAAEAALRRAREEGPQRRRRSNQMPVHEARPAPVQDRPFHHPLSEFCCCRLRRLT